MKYPKTAYYEGIEYHGKVIDNEIRYIQMHGLTRSIGFINLQDIEKTYTSRDIYWVTSFNCGNETLVNKIFIQG